MTDRDKFQQFIDELQKAVEQGSLPRDILEFARSMLIVGGDMINSQAIIGNNNVVNYYPQTSAVEEKIELDEQALIADALAAYRKGQAAEQGNVSEEPYPGLFAYRIQDSNHFFGRDDAIAELTVELEHRQVTWLHGRSGTGKSSLIQAGLMPALLKRNAFPIWIRSFDESPITELKKALLKRRWSKDLKLGEESLLQFLSKVDSVLKGQPIYIFFDQFEEFIIRLPESKQEEFARELADCVADASLPIHFIFSLRSDYFGETSILRERLQAGAGREYVVRPLKPDEARQAIISPLEQLGMTYQDGLVDTILDHLGAVEVNSPQLQLVCEKLFHNLPANNRQITFEHYQYLGETRGIINDYLKQALHDQQMIPSSQYKAATYILSTLVTLDGRRDMKSVSDWYADERLRLLTLGWHIDKEHLPTPDSPLAMQSMDPVTVANFIEQVKKHVSAQGDDLRQIVDNMLNGYVLKSQRTFVDEVVRSLRDARLLHEIQSDDGELSYELIHDYLIAEVMGWLDEDEQNARQLRNKLNQKQLDFKQHKLLLEPKELEIISSQLDNPKLLLQDSDKRLLLLSAAAHGTGRQWLTLSGSNGLIWLREACWDERLLDNVRQGAAALLGEINDEETFGRLSLVEQPVLSKKMDLLAHYVNHSTRKHKLPGVVNLLIFYKLAGLQAKDGSGERAKMRWSAAIIGALCVTLHLLILMLNPNLQSRYSLPVVLILAFVGAGMASVFAEVMTRTKLIARRWNILLQALILAGLGSTSAVLLNLLIAEQADVRWLSGAIIGLALTLMQIKTSARIVLNPAVVAVITGVIIMALAYDTLDQTWWGESSASLFAGMYIYFAALHSKNN